LIKRLLTSILESLEGEPNVYSNTPNAKSEIEHQDSELFDDIYGFDDIKELFTRAISSEKQISILLVGPPASAKSLFMQELMNLDGSYYTLGSNSTKSGMVDALFELEPRFLIIDEIEKMSIRDQTVLLSLMEGGIISETKHRKTRRIELNTSVFAASNSIETLLPPLLTRFAVLHLQPYSFDEFMEITRKVLYREGGISSAIADMISDAVWNQMKSSNIRDCVKIGRLARSTDEINSLVNTFDKYKSVT
jgi:Holliday junction resolvasome RuvABC ATP-dependent DNA helicase subunit